MKKILLSLCTVLILGTTASANDNSAKGLNVMITSEDAQTQMMGMVLSTMTLKKARQITKNDA